MQYDCDTRSIHSSAAGRGGHSANQHQGSLGEEAASPKVPPILATSWCPPKFQAHQTNAFKADCFPHTSLLRSRYPSTHSQWLQDLYPVLSARLPGNWLLLPHRSAPLSLLCALASPLLPRRLLPHSSSRPVVSRQSTLLAPRRLFTVIFQAHS